MKKAKKRIVIVSIVCFIILLGSLIADSILGKSYLKEIKYDKVIEKVEKKDNFVLLISQTTCSHCMDYKPKLAKVAKKYKVNVYYLEVDLLSDEDRDKIKSYFSYSSTPTTVFVINGEEKTAANRIVGDVSEDKIVSKLKSNGFID